MENYFTTAAVSDDDDLLRWWKRKAPTFPVITVKWLSYVAASVPSELAFSTAGNIVATKRSSLHPDVVRDLIFIHENYVEERQRKS
ncbi:LOW QUALITY PROTEIN: hypothetical protein PHMEG_0007249 [Phytophthora megakarya]|uniref:HAT C-terminal dimerisation domain-containing protein n=1 Tax=Phytophthora megakarya TaxID=4795 RepID=A0A225WP62_9STRA|nr:LOW QUALITY PROTEIN: hypothetical protein PHMEG_0007249 [Phytophthora megakarya]